nr:hypothetical protein [Tanacetum cinerariifolium]
MLSTTQMRTMFISGLERVIGRRIIRSLRSPKPDLIGIHMVSTNPNGKGINVIKGSASSIDLKAYSDADWVRCVDPRSISTIKIAANRIFHERT